MKRLVPEWIEEIPSYVPGKSLEELQRESGIRESIKLASNENPLGSSPLAIRKIKEYLGNLNRYPDSDCKILKEELSSRLGISKEEIIIGNGSDEIIELAIKTLLRPHQAVIIPEPGFLMYERVSLSMGARIKKVPLREFNIDLERILKLIDSDTKIIFLNNPHNPTGSAIKFDSLVEFIDQIPRDIIVVIDEAYIEFVDDPEIRTAIELLKKSTNLIVIRTFSKLYGLAGLRIGYGIGASKLIHFMNRVRQPFNVNTLGQVAATAALKDRDFIDATLRLVSKGKEYIYSELKRLRLNYIPSHTNFILIETPLNAKDLYAQMLKEGVIIRPMDGFGLPKYIRVNVGLMEENRKFISALEKSLRGKK